MTTVKPTVDERGDEQHPAWALIGASRVSAQPGAILFDSDIKHNRYVVVTIKAAKRRRDLNRDWIYSGGEYIEIAVSEAQWASFVSTMNVGDGVPCTLTRLRGEGAILGMPYEPRLQESMAEVHDAADRALGKVAEAFAVYAEHKTVGNLRALEAAIRNSGPNIDFAAKSLSEHAENVVQRARADVEAMIVQKAQQLGIDPGEVGTVAELTTGDDDR